MKQSTIFDTWYSNSTEMMNNWHKMTEKINTDQKPLWDDARNIQKKWIEDFQKMIQNMQNPFMPGGKSGFSQNTMKDVFENMLNSTDMYIRLYKLWQPVFDAMENNTFHQQDLWKLIDPHSFKEFVDRFFGYAGFNPMKDFIDRSNQLMKQWFDSAGDTGKGFSKMFNNNPFSNFFANSNSESMFNLYMEMLRSGQRSFSTFFGNGLFGSSDNYFDSMAEMMEVWTEYVSKGNQMQEMIYKVSTAAWEKVMESINDKVKDGTSVNDFKEFYNEWSAINEKEFVELFNTDEYATLQADLIKLNSRLNTMYEKQIEDLMKPFPIVHKSQLEGLYEVNHELRTKLNNLERLVEELRNTVSTNTQTEDNKTETN
ncbi:hypothetical protein QFZ37_002732 [Chryseobacterium ginsenosidimutans]|uniref:poly(R)-hydroxyalkanoic acid synthase subunit PhaE n=1 Tax=Chryseobacterium ginsenosidimutans TaxID=687846 RepID=UPI00277F4E00|nr:poly(R)-hydroxyalkanoic acid synthase subunit PhaE [Chryseobacterium ginsenosidimutans]MDQ0594363.1 hypothetical protein [Chryseobacterium ginsenosidimutans]